MLFLFQSEFRNPESQIEGLDAGNGKALGSRRTEHGGWIMDAKRRIAPLKERYALGALRLRSVPSELKAFLPQAQRSSSETLLKRSAPIAVRSTLRSLRPAGPLIKPLFQGFNHDMQAPWFKLGLIKYFTEGRNK